MRKHETSLPTPTKTYLDRSDEEDESSSEDEEELVEALADVTFEELQKARSDGSQAAFRIPDQDKKTKRANKNRPMEATSTKPVSRFREVIQVPKKTARDPRFETLCGKLDTDGFRQRYAFLYENDLPAEKEEVKKKLKNSKDPKVIDDLKKRMMWIDNQLRAGSAKRTDADILAAHKKKEREAAKQGKKPYYLKKSEIRKQKHIEKYESLKESGKLDHFIEKRRKQNASKDHRYMPYRRSTKEAQ